jgi:hypothetical protein
MARRLSRSFDVLKVSKRRCATPVTTTHEPVLRASISRQPYNEKVEARDRSSRGRLYAGDGHGPSSCSYS